MIIEKRIYMIKLKNVSKFYYNKGLITSGFSRINVEFNLGEFVAITGESGSGKSTLLNVLSGLDSYEEGEMYINNEETSHYTEEDYENYRKKYISNIFQNFNLVNSYTVYQNIELILLISGYKKREIKQKVLELIKTVDLYKYRNQKVSKLSGGQKQRVAIARALAQNTPVIIADEPTGNLDKKSAESVLKTLKKVSENKLVIVVTHNYEYVEQYATRKITMSDGKIIEDKVIIETKENNITRLNEYKKMPLTNKLRLGIRNSFNIPVKLLLLLTIFCFMFIAIITEVSSFKRTKQDELLEGYNSYLRDTNNSRIILNKKDHSKFDENDLKQREKENNKYFKIGLTSFVVIAMSILFFALITHLQQVGSVLNKILSALAPFVCGLIIAYFLIPVLNYLERKFIKPETKLKTRKKLRILFIVIIMSCVFFLIGEFINLIVPEMAESFKNISRNYPRYEKNVHGWFNDLLVKHPELDDIVNDDFINVQKRFNDWVAETVVPRLNDGIKAVTSGLYSAVKAVINTIIGIIVSVYVMYNKEMYAGQMKKIVYACMKRKTANNFIHNIRYINKTFQNFFVGKIIDSLIIGLICFIACTVLQMPYSALISIIIGITNIVPVFGPFIGAIPSAILVFMVSPQKCLVFVIMIIILQQFDGNILGPKILGSSTGLSSFWVLFAITFFGSLWNFVGMLVGVPIMAVVYSAIKAYTQTKLQNKKLHTDTDQYIDVSYIDDSHNYIMIPKEQIKGLSDEKNENAFSRFIKEHFGSNDDEDNVDNVNPDNTDKSDNSDNSDNPDNSDNSDNKETKENSEKTDNKDNK